MPRYHRLIDRPSCHRLLTLQATTVCTEILGESCRVGDVIQILHQINQEESHWLRTVLTGKEVDQPLGVNPHLHPIINERQR
ncbi:MAG: hypothetical protein M1600_11145 [Firmicutes bacterium]|nr:hypothetical protein [Bacillota bacterium]